MNKIELFMEYLQNCKKHKGKLQQIMAKKDVALFVQSYHDIMKMVNENPDMIDQLVKDFKMSPHSVRETLYMGKFLENLTVVAQKEFDKKNEQLKH